MNINGSAICKVLFQVLGGRVGSQTDENTCPHRADILIGGNRQQTINVISKLSDVVRGGVMG